MSENENEFTHTDGVVYVAVDSTNKDGSPCCDCVFNSIGCVIQTNPCFKMGRTDRRNIIWQPKADQ